MHVLRLSSGSAQPAPPGMSRAGLAWGQPPAITTQQVGDGRLLKGLVTAGRPWRGSCVFAGRRPTAACLATGRALVCQSTPAPGHSCRAARIRGQPTMHAVSRRWVQHSTEHVCTTVVDCGVDPGAGWRA